MPSPPGPVLYTVRGVVVCTPEWRVGPGLGPPGAEPDPVTATDTVLTCAMGGGWVAMWSWWSPAAAGEGLRPG